jgi:hypothetical protein
MTIIVCKSCAEILHSKHTHDFVQCSCPNGTFADGGAAYSRCGGKDLDLILKCGTVAEAKRVAQTLKLKDTLKVATEPTFYDVMVKRLSKKRADEITKVIRQLLKNRNSAVVRSDLVNPDYCNAFGIMQGVAYSLGFNAMNSNAGQPRRWFDDMLKEYPYPLTNRFSR